MTTVTHRPGCPRPGWDVVPARSIRGVQVARCEGCGAVELRRESDLDAPPTLHDPHRPPATLPAKKRSTP